MLGAIGSFFNSVLTRPGTNALREQEKRKTDIGKSGADLLNLYLPLAKSQAEYANRLEPSRQASINRTLLLNQPGTLAGLGQKQASLIDGQLGGDIRDIENQFASQGLSAGATAGAVSDARNNATNQRNAVLGQQFDPQYLAQLQGLVQQVIAGGQSVNTGLAGVSSGANIAYGEPTVQLGQGFADIVGQALGSWGASRSSGGTQAPSSVVSGGIQGLGGGAGGALPLSDAASGYANSGQALPFNVPQLINIMRMANLAR